MLLISIPDELALPYLLELRDLSPAMRSLCADAWQQLADGDLAGALSVTDRSLALTTSRADRYGSAIALLVRAEAFRLGQRWENSLDAIRRALQWLEVRIAPVARYNEAVAVYLEGTIHLTLRARQKVVETFAYARDLLRDSERHWIFEQATGRATDCRRVAQWMSQLLVFADGDVPDEPTWILPVYELIGGALVQMDVLAVQPYQAIIPSEIMGTYLPSRFIPVQIDAVPFLSLNPSRRYVAVRIPEDGYALFQANYGDLLIVELTGSLAADQGLTLTDDRPFTRSPDGRVVYRSVASGHSSPGGLNRGVVGIPRVIVREAREL
jgi:hypothetical protein